MFDNPLAGTGRSWKALRRTWGATAGGGRLADRDAGVGSLRQEVAALRTEMQDVGSLRQEVAAMRTEMQRLLAIQKL